MALSKPLWCNHPDGGFQLKSQITERRSAAGIAFVLASILIAVGWITFRGYVRLQNPQFLTVHPRQTPFFGESQINAYLLTISPAYDSGGQRLAHKCIVACVAITVLASSYFQMATPLWNRRGFRKWAYITCLTVWGCLLLRSAVFELKGHSWKSGLVFWGIACLAATRFGQHGRRWIYAGLCVLFLAWAILPGLVRIPDLSSETPSTVTSIETHYSLVFGQVDRLAAGHRMFSEVKPAYGVLFHVLLSGVARTVGGFSVGNYVTFFQLSNAAYLLIAVTVFASYARGRWGLVLIGILMVAPWYHSQSACIWFPNQAAWRTLAFPMSFALLFGVRFMLLSRVAFSLGLLGAAAILINFESGVACAIGQMTFLWFRDNQRTLRTRIAVASCYAAGYCSALILILALFRFVLGYWLQLTELWRVGEYALFWVSSGFGGSRYKGDLFPVVLLLHAAYILIYSALLPAKDVQFRDAFRAAVAATILVWFSYYANRPEDWNLSSFSFLYAFLVMDLVRRVVVAFRRRWTDRVEIEPALCLVLLLLIVGPWVAQRFTLEGIESGLMPPSGSAERQLVSGVYLSRAMAEALAEKSSVLIDEPAAQEMMYVTFHSMFVPCLTRLHPRLPFGNAVTECYDKTRYDATVRFLRSSSANVIYFDLREVEQPEFVEFYWDLRSDLQPHYQPTRAVNGWELWERAR